MRDIVNEDIELRRFAPGVLQPHLPAPVDPVLRVLIEGRRKIENPDQWVKGALMIERAGGRAYCALGACDFSEEAGERSGASDYLRAAIPKSHRAEVCRLSSYNNHPDTTHADVLSLFDRAIASRKAAQS